ncbi:hypothetical protein Tco_1267963 [Tanacetum coccineum]
MLLDREATYARRAWTGFEDRSAAIEAHARTLEAHVATLMAQTSSLQTQLTTSLRCIQTLEARDPEPRDEPAEAGSSSYSYEASHNSIPRKEEDLGSFTLPCFINNVCFNNALADLGASVSVMPLSTYLNLGLGELAHTKLTVELADRTMKYPKGIAENVLVGIGKFVFPIDFIILDMTEDIKVLLILGRPFLSTAHAKIDVFKRKITLRVGKEKIIFISVKPARSLIKKVYMLSLRERMELDLEARLMGETLVLNRSLDPFFEDYIELSDLNVPLELRRDQVDNLMPTIEEGEVVEEFRARNDARMVSKFFGYPSDCNYDKKIRIDCAYNLKFSCMIDFAVLEDMDAYRDEGMGDVIFGEPFLREVRINGKQFEGMITIHNGNEEVTYQMVRSHLRFKNHTNEQCNKIPPLQKVRIYQILQENRQKRAKHEHGNQKSIREAKDSKPKPKKVKIQSTLVNRSQPQKGGLDYSSDHKHDGRVRFVKSSTLIGSLKLRRYVAGRKAQGDVDFTLKALTQQKQGCIKGLPAWQSM